MIRFLCEETEGLRQLNSAGQNPLQYAFYENKPESYDCLFDLSPEELRFSNGANVTSCVVEKELFDVAIKFFEKDPQRVFDKSPNQQGFTPLHVMLSSDFGQVSDKEGFNGLLRGIVGEIRGCLEKKTYEERKVTIANLDDDNLKSPLFYALASQDVESLLSLGFDCDKCDESQKSSFDYACDQYDAVVESRGDLKNISKILTSFYMKSRDGNRGSRLLEDALGGKIELSDVIRSNLYADMKNPSFSDDFSVEFQGNANIVDKIRNYQYGKRSATASFAVNSSRTGSILVQEGAGQEL